MAVSDVPLGYLRRTAAENLPPPIAHTGILGWLRANLLSSPANIVLTVICASLIIWVVPPLLRFFLIDAVWSGSDRTACLATAANPDPGACWAFVRVWFSYFVYGFYPIAQRWRVDVFFAALVFGIAWLAWQTGAASRSRRDLFLRRAAADLAGVALRLSGHRPRCSADRPVGRHACDHCGRRCRHRRLAAARHFAGVGTAVRAAGGAVAVDRLHRIRARRAADHGAVHGERDAAAVRAPAL